MCSYGTETRMKADKRAAADRDARRRAGHHVVIARAVIALIVADRADDGQLVGDVREPLHVLRELDARRARLDWLKLAADLARGVWFRVERLVMGGAAVHPDEDAASRDWRACV